MEAPEVLALLIYGLIAILAIVFTIMATSFMLAISLRLWQMFIPKSDLLSEYFAEASVLKRLYEKGYSDEKTVRAFSKNFLEDVFGLSLQDK